jgi:hypothetical protein
MTAEAGIGKTRFAAEVKRFAAGYDVGAGRFATHTGARVLRARCRAFGERRRFAPLADIVRKSVGLPKDAVAAVTRPVVEERLRKQVNRLSRDGETPAVDIDRLLVLLGYGEPPVNPVGPTAVADWQPPAPARRVRPSRSPLPACSPRSPRKRRLLVIVDDLHDATAETIDALGSTLSRLDGPVEVLLLGRPELVRTAGALTRLADAEVHTPAAAARGGRGPAAHVVPGRRQAAAADADRLLATAQGNPFYWSSWSRC